jgi:fatty acid-binding protein DegV
LDKLREFVASASDIEDIAIVHSTSKDEAVDSAHQINTIYPQKILALARFGPVLGAHGGPGVIGLGYLKKIPIPSIIYVSLKIVWAL